jgi:hypothetical protein
MYLGNVICNATK